MGEYTYYIMLGGILVLFVIMTVLPQRRQRKKTQEMMNSMRVGSVVQTIGGFRGTIVQLSEDNIVFECGPDKARLTVVRNAIAQVFPAESSEEPAAIEAETTSTQEEVKEDNE